MKENHIILPGYLQSPSGSEFYLPPLAEGLREGGKMEIIPLTWFLWKTISFFPKKEFSFKF